MAGVAMGTPETANCPVRLKSVIPSGRPSAVMMVARSNAAIGLTQHFWTPVFITRESILFGSGLFFRSFGFGFGGGCRGLFRFGLGSLGFAGFGLSRLVAAAFLFCRGFVIFAAVIGDVKSAAFKEEACAGTDLLFYFAFTPRF